ncbi:serine hydrolase domain-containing protein [Luteimonas aestuarii]|nr:serine hydrolase domain-containing protein [Luteimonas aestuarii]
MTLRRAFHRAGFSLCLSMSALTASAQDNAVPALASPAELGFDAARLAELDRTLQGYVDRGELPGASVLVARHGRIVHLAAFGQRDIDTAAPMADDTIIRVYSMAKPVTAAAVMAAYEKGGFSLSDPVARYVPELADVRVYADGEGDAIETVPAQQQMTIENLLTHTAGFTMSFQIGTPVAKLYQQAGLQSATWFLDGSIPDLGAFAERISSVPLAYQPDERWHYGLGFDIAALVVERTRGQGFDAFLQERILGPLKMGDTGFHVPEGSLDRFASLYARNADGGLVAVETPQRSAFLKPPAVATGSGALVSTILDYYRFAQMLCNGGELDGVRVLRPGSVDLMLSNHLREDQFGQLAEATPFGFGGTGTGVGFGYGGAVVLDDEHGGEGTYMWGGAGSTTFFVDRRNGIVAVLMTQLMPSGTYPLGDVLKTAVYEALVDPAH